LLRKVSRSGSLLLQGWGFSSLLRLDMLREQLVTSVGTSAEIGKIHADFKFLFIYSFVLIWKKKKNVLGPLYRVELISGALKKGTVSSD
jgi:hypothetical protein